MRQQSTSTKPESHTSVPLLPPSPPPKVREGSPCQLSLGWSLCFSPAQVVCRVASLSPPQGPGGESKTHINTDETSKVQEKEESPAQQPGGEQGVNSVKLRSVANEIITTHKSSPASTRTSLTMNTHRGPTVQHGQKPFWCPELLFQTAIPSMASTPPRIDYMSLLLSKLGGEHWNVQNKHDQASTDVIIMDEFSTTLQPAKQIH